VLVEAFVLSLGIGGGIVFESKGVGGGIVFEC
jgi:hypothetical protein